MSLWRKWITPSPTVFAFSSTPTRKRSGQHIWTKPWPTIIERQTRPQASVHNSFTLASLSRKTYSLSMMPENGLHSIRERQSREGDQIWPPQPLLRFLGRRSGHPTHSGQSAFKKQALARKLWPIQNPQNYWSRNVWVGTNWWRTYSSRKRSNSWDHRYCGLISTNGVSPSDRNFSAGGVRPCSGHSVYSWPIHWP